MQIMKFPRSFLSILTSTLTVSRHSDFSILSHLHFFFFSFSSHCKFSHSSWRAHWSGNFICLTLSFSLEGREGYVRVVAFKFFYFWFLLSIAPYTSSSSFYYSSFNFTQIYCPWYLFYGCILIFILWLPYEGCPSLRCC